MRENYTLIRLYLENALRKGALIALDKPHIHYLMTVLRKSIGDRVRLFNGRDGEWMAEITSLTRKEARLIVKEQLRPSQASPDIWLCFAPVKKHRNAFIIEKGTELGVGTFQAVITQRTQFPKLNLERLRAQMIEASEQTERLDIPNLAQIVDLNSWLETWDPSRTIVFADEAGAGLNAHDAISEIDGPCALLIGPEGGFTPDERELIKSYDFVKAVTLGPRILRADTAALALLTLWQAQNGDWR